MLLEIFKDLLLVVGITFLVLLFIALIQVPFIQYKENKCIKESQKELNHLLNKWANEIEKEIKNANKKEAKTTKKTNKKKED